MVTIMCDNEVQSYGEFDVGIIGASGIFIEHTVMKTGDRNERHFLLIQGALSISSNKGRLEFKVFNVYWVLRLQDV